MKKYGITQDTLSFPLDDDDEVVGSSARGNGDVARTDPSDGQA